jgi:hypothetical protein
MGINLNRVTIVDIELRIFFIVLVFFRISTSDNLPANFVFGDSLVDAGNNNYIISLSKANFLPNGIDFGRPTGRFTNGRTIVDIIGKILSVIIYFILLDWLLFLYNELYILAPLIPMSSANDWRIVTN